MTPLPGLGSPSSSWLNYYPYKKNKIKTIEKQIGNYTRTLRYIYKDKGHYNHTTVHLHHKQRLCITK